VIVRPLRPADEAAILAWRYEGAYATYDVDDPADLEHGHFAVEDGGELVGFCCFGGGARVDGVAEEDGVLDVGYGMRPDLMGQGRGAAFVAVILAFGVERFEPQRLRMSILRWNARSRRAAERQGFALVRAAGEFDVLEREP
jgi:ribosomal-protein-alanine N-acetyltransferase